MEQKQEGGHASPGSRLARRQAKCAGALGGGGLGAVRTDGRPGWGSLIELSLETMLALFTC